MRWVTYSYIFDNFPSISANYFPVTRHENNWSLRGGYSLPLKHLLLIILSPNWLSIAMDARTGQGDSLLTLHSILSLVPWHVAQMSTTQQHHNNNKVMKSVNCPEPHGTRDLWFKTTFLNKNPCCQKRLPPFQTRNWALPSGQGRKLEQLVIFVEEHSIFMAITSKNIRQQQSFYYVFIETTKLTRKCLHSLFRVVSTSEFCFTWICQRSPNVFLTN